MIPRDKDGWPVVTIIGRPFVNIIRYLLHTDIKKTLFTKDPPELRHMEPDPNGPTTPGYPEDCSPTQPA